MSDTATRGNLTISGAGTIATGTYRRVSVAGSATIDGDIECAAFKVSGTTNGSGSLKAETISVSGAMRLDGSVSAEEIKVAGSAWFGGDVHAGNLRVAGTVDAGGDFSGETVALQGFLRVRGDCAVERFGCEGGFEVSGLLNAGVVDVALGAPCTATEIGGESISVRYASWALKRLVAKLLPSQSFRLTAETIEGDDVRLENTTAKVVRGTHVTLGPGCDIDLVEYSEGFERASGAKVKTARKSAPAPLAR